MAASVDVQQVDAMCALVYDVKHRSDMYARKVKINTMHLENIRLNMEFMNKSMQMQKIALVNHEQRADLIKESTAMCERQIAEEKEGGNIWILEIERKLNQLYDFTPEYHALCDEMDQLREKMLATCEEIKKVESQIPDLQAVNEFKLNMQSDMSGASEL
jgi:DNA repair ATPase RecN